MFVSIDHHISALLFHHEIVVIPDFGAFITRKAPAELHAATGMLRPPSKRVAFNQRIKDNDGVLARYISKCENISCHEALDHIAAVIQEWQQTINAGKRVHLHGIGKIFMDEGRRIQFSPGLEMNYDLKAYGLTIFRTEAIKRSVSVQQKVRKATQEKEIALSSAKAKTTATTHRPEPKRSKAKPFMRWAAILIPIAALSAVGYLYQDQIGDKMSNISALSPFPIIKSWGLKTTQTEGLAPAQSKNTTRSVNYNKAVIDTNQSPGSLPKKSPGSASNPAPATNLSIDENKAVTEKERLTQHPIVVGSFSSTSNADNYAANLRQDGYQVEVKKHESRDMYRVIIWKQGEKSQALAQIKENVNSRAWTL